MNVSMDIVKHLEQKEADDEANEEECLALEEIRRLKMELTGLTNSLCEYGRHQEGCNAQFGDTYRCRCGWREVEAELKKGEG